MTSQNEEAEELMRRIEKEEERLSFQEPDKQCFHLCIVNLGFILFYYYYLILLKYSIFIMPCYNNNNNNYYYYYYALL
jgi:hypothetical protein